MTAPFQTRRFSEPTGATTVALPAEVREISIANTAGSMVLRGSDRSDVRIAWVKRGEPGTPEWDGLELEVETSLDRISVQPRHPERRPGASRVIRSGGAASAGDMGARLDIDIEAPREMSAMAVALASGSGETSADAIACRALRLVVASGNVRVRDIAGEVRIQSASGDVEASGIAGEVSVRTASGDVAIVAHAACRLAVETASGDVRLRALEPLDGLVRTVSGDVLAELAERHGWGLDFRTVTGSAAVPPRYGSAGRKAWVATGSSGLAGSLKARTVSGELRVIDLAAAHGAGEASTKRPPASSRDDILRAVERGDLGVDDALRLLDDLAGGAQPA